MDSTPLMQVIWQTSSHLKLGRKVSRWLRLLCVLIVGIGLLLLVAALRLKSNEFDPYITNYSANSLTLSQVFKRIFLANSPVSRLYSNKHNSFTYIFYEFGIFLCLLLLHK